MNKQIFWVFGLTLAALPLFGGACGDDEELKEPIAIAGKTYAGPTTFTALFWNGENTCTGTWDATVTFDDQGNFHLDAKGKGFTHGGESGGCNTDTIETGISATGAASSDTQKEGGQTTAESTLFFNECNDGNLAAIGQANVVGDGPLVGELACKSEGETQFKLQFSLPRTQ